MTSLSSSNPSQGVLSSFPFLTPDEFDHACGALCDRFHAWQILNPGSWLTIRFMHQQVVRLTHVFFVQPIVHKLGMIHVIRRLRYHDILRIPVLTMRKMRQRGSPLILGNHSWKKHQNTILSVDIGPNIILCSLWHLSNNSNQEALIRTIEPNASLQVEYDIVLSPTYQVPVLYFMLRWTNQKGPAVGIDSVYQYLVPDQYRKQLKSVGIMGGISFDYHPISGVPSFFVHPCNTAEAMRHIAGEQTVTPETYLIIWLGLVGHCVGLHLPPGLFATEEKSARTPETLG